MTEIHFIGYKFLFNGGVLVLSLENKGKAVIQTSDISVSMYLGDRIKIFMKNVVFIGLMPDENTSIQFFNTFMKIIESQFKQLDFSGLTLKE